MTTDMRSLKFFKGSGQNTLIMNGLVLDGDDRVADESIGERQLGRFVLPPFQRPGVWDRERQVRLIESIWLGLPIAAYVYNQAPWGGQASPTDMWLIDGQQRWTAIHAYVAGDFEVFGNRYPDLSREDKIAFRQTTFPSIMLQSNDPELLRDVYERLAFGGVAHEPEDRPSLGLR